MVLTTLDIKNKTFRTKFRGYSEIEVDEFLDIIVSDFERLTQRNSELESKMEVFEEKLSYFDDLKESLSKSVILAQETAEKVKAAAYAESDNILTHANNQATLLLEETQQKANEMLRDAADEAKKVAMGTEDLKRQTRIFHQRLLSSVESHLALINEPEWDTLLEPSVSYVENPDTAFREVVQSAMQQANDIKDKQQSDAHSIAVNDDILHQPLHDDTTRQFSPEEMADLQRRVEESNRKLEETIAGQAPLLTDEVLSSSFADNESQSTTISSENQEEDSNFDETQTFKLNI